MSRAALLAVALAACGGAGGACPAGYGPATVAELHFGVGAREEAWRDFLAESVTPLFPDGLTAWAAEGQWRESAAAPVVSEPARVLRIVLPAHDAAAAAARVAPAVASGKAWLRQDAVLVTLTPGCAALR